MLEDEFAPLMASLPLFTSAGDLPPRGAISTPLREIEVACGRESGVESFITSATLGDPGSVFYCLSEQQTL